MVVLVWKRRLIGLELKPLAFTPFYQKPANSDLFTQTATAVLGSKHALGVELGVVVMLLLLERLAWRAPPRTAGNDKADLFMSGPAGLCEVAGVEVPDPKTVSLTTAPWKARRCRCDVILRTPLRMAVSGFLTPATPSSGMAHHRTC